MSKFNRGYKFKIYPTEDQAKQIDRFIDFTRYVYNWGIAKEREIYELCQEGLTDGKSFYTYFELETLFRYERDNNPDMYWVKEFPLTTAKLALRNVYNGYKRFFKDKNGKVNIPNFKSKKRSKKSFNTRNDTFKIENDRIKIEGINTRISLGFNSELIINENKNSSIQAINPVITKDNLGDYYVSFSLEEETKMLDKEKSEGIGIDVGERRTYTLSTGEIINQPKDKLEKLERRRKMQQRHVTRDINRRYEESIRTKTKYEDIPKSKRAIKREEKLRKTERKIHNIKNTFYDQTTSEIVKRNPEYVCMETLSVSDMKKSKNIRKDLNTSFYDMSQKMKNKCEQNNIPFIQAPTYFPSTKTCSNCGYIKIMKGKHTYKCPNCGMVEDRDINAAINLMNYGLEYNNNLVRGVYYDLG